MLGLSSEGLAGWEPMGGWEKSKDMPVSDRGWEPEGGIEKSKDIVFSDMVGNWRENEWLTQVESLEAGSDCSS